jgi:hypothetical protein
MHVQFTFVSCDFRASPKPAATALAALALLRR